MELREALLKIRKNIRESGIDYTADKNYNIACDALNDEFETMIDNKLIPASFKDQNSYRKVNCCGDCTYLRAENGNLACILLDIRLNDWEHICDKWEQR